MLPSEGPPPAGAAPKSGLALAMLFLVGLLNFVDRQILSVLVEPIRQDLMFSDLQFGLLTGLTFSLFYSLAAVPIAVAADRSHRVRLIATCCGLWSLFTAACGLAGSFLHLAIARFGVGIGEAGGTAPSLSLLSDLFPPARRAWAIGLFSLNGPLGVFLGTSLAAWAAAEFGWRWVFFIMGAVGLIVAPLLLLLVREPVRGSMDSDPLAATAERLRFRQTLERLKADPALRWTMVVCGLGAFVSYGMLNWLPAYLMRSEAMPLAAMGKWFAVAAGGTLGLGMWLGGTLAARQAEQAGRGGYAVVPGAASVLLVPALSVALLLDGWTASLAGLLVPMTLCTMYIAPMLALTQELARPAERATVSALVMLAFNIVGLGFGPLFVGAVSDMVQPAFGDDSIGVALFGLVPVAACGALASFRLAYILRRDMDSGQSQPAYA
ncbi:MULTISPECIES: spinster family MFS transporter [Pacificimonas]|nr:MULTISPECIES: MFS transporter [Pacificimonas]MBZ6379594.1 MFS transporter [Pacificimonas aurantium]